MVWVLNNANGHMEFLQNARWLVYEMDLLPFGFGSIAFERILLGFFLGDRFGPWREK